MNHTRFRRVALACAALALPEAAGAQSLRPRNLLVYYGFPSGINATHSVPAAALEFGRYDYVLWGEGVDDPTHADHANAMAILAHEATAATRFFGYVDLGVSTQNLSMIEVQARIARWDAMGVEGVHFDNFGYDFGTTRGRQNEAVDFAHARGLAVIVNAFQPEDAFASAVDPVHNPTGAAARLSASDYYFYESHGVRLGQYEGGEAWARRSDALEVLRQGVGFGVLSTTTTGTDDPAAYDEAAFHYAWHAALLYGHEATGWAEYGYSASGNSNTWAPFRARPPLDPGSVFTSPVQHMGSLHWRYTDRGRIDLDSASHDYEFTNTTDVAGEGARAASALTAYPNPSRGSTRFSFTLNRACEVRLNVYDAAGRRVAEIQSGELRSGRHERRWLGVDGHGGQVSAGSYFAVLEACGARTVAKFVFD